MTRSIAAAMHAPTPLAGVNGTVCCEGDGLWPCGVRASGLSPRRGRRLTPQNPAAQHPDPSGRIQAARQWRRRRPAAGPGRARTAARRMQGGADAGAGAPGPPPGPGCQAMRRGHRRRCARTAARRRQGGAGAGAGAPGPPPDAGKAARVGATCCTAAAVKP